jgi:probable rRNA maturation factor
LEVALQNPSRFGSLDLRSLRPWLEELTRDLAPEADSVTVRLISDREMRELNRVYRDRDRTTDVLSFPGEETPEGRHLGDVVVAVPTARRQAAARGHELQRELRTLLLHGLLHCLGYDHERDEGEMERVERRLRRRWLDREVT